MVEALGELQLQVMEVVWRLGKATVADVHGELAVERKIAYTTVLTTMRALERRGMVTHETVGKAYLYRPAVSRDQYTDARVDRLVDNLFGGRQEKLLCRLLGADRISRTELARIRRIVQQADEGAK